MAPKIKHRAKVILTDSKGRTLRNGWHKDDLQTSADLHTWGAYLRVPVGKKIGVSETYTVEVTYLGEHEYKQTYQQRVKAHDRNEKRREAQAKEQERLKLERQEKLLVQRRKRIVNQIELAFVKKCRGAVDFITCDQCDAMATFLGLAYENPGAQSIDPDQITGAWCEEHGLRKTQYGVIGTLPFKTKASIACERLEFFYDGLRQIYVKQ